MADSRHAHLQHPELSAAWTLERREKQAAKNRAGAGVKQEPTVVAKRNAYWTSENRVLHGQRVSAGHQRKYEVLH